MQFLRHIERTRLLVHLVDVSDASGRPDVVKDSKSSSANSTSFGAHLAEKPMLMVASKIDAANKDSWPSSSSTAKRKSYLCSQSPPSPAKASRNSSTPWQKN